MQLAKRYTLAQNRFASNETLNWFYGTLSDEISRADVCIEVKVFLCRLCFYKEAFLHSLVFLFMDY